MSLVENIKSEAIKKRTTIPKIEKELGFGKGSMYNWDKNSPSIDKIQKVADYFKVSVDYLFYGFHREWLARGLKLLRGERTLTQFAQDTGIDADELHELCAGTSKKQPSLETIEKIIATDTSGLSIRNDILEAAGYDPNNIKSTIIDPFCGIGQLDIQSTVASILKQSKENEIPVLDDPQVRALARRSLEKNPEKEKMLKKLIQSMLEED